MPKINQEEYEILKEKSKVGYEWIARDESGSCFIYELKPMKNSRYEFWEWEGNEMIGKIFNSSLFQFIQWEDEEPHNIQELIEEYESEETEVKDIEWLKENVKEEYEYNREKHNKEGFEGYAHREFVFKYVLNLIDQLDEPEVLSQEEVDQAYKDGYEKGKQHTFYKGYLEGLADKENEPETVADVVTTFWKSFERLKEVMSMEVEELEE